MTTSNQHKDQEFTAEQLEHAVGLLSNAEARLDPVLDRLEAASKRVRKHGAWDAGFVLFNLGVSVVVTRVLLILLAPWAKEMMDKVTHSHAPIPATAFTLLAALAATLMICVVTFIALHSLVGLAVSLYFSIQRNKLSPTEELDDATRAVEAEVRAIEGEGKAGEGFITCFAALLDGGSEAAARAYLKDIHLNGYNGKPERYRATLRALRRGAKARLGQLAGDTLNSYSADWLKRQELHRLSLGLPSEHRST